MERLVPLTKIILTVAFSICAITLQNPVALGILFLIELALIAGSGLFRRQAKAVGALVVFAFILGLIQYIFTANLSLAYVTGFRMLCMTEIFIVLLGTMKLQDLTASLVLQCRIPYEYAFMFTSCLRFVPDFVRESKAVQEAQSCRGMDRGGNIFHKIRCYTAVIQPLLLKSLGRSETMALSLELRGFGSKNRNFVNTVALQAIDYFIICILIVATAICVLWARHYIVI